MKKVLIPVTIFCVAACNNVQSTSANTAEPASAEMEVAKAKHFRGAISNGMKGDSLFFDLSADGKKIENLTFKGWWRCSGKLEQLTAAGPEGSFAIVNGKVDGSIAEPPNGGSTAWRFELKAAINNKKANGTFRMNINNLGCDSYVLKFDASAL